MLKFQAVIDLETNTAATPKQIQDAILLLLQPLMTDRGWRIHVWPIEPRDPDA